MLLTQERELIVDRSQNNFLRENRGFQMTSQIFLHVKTRGTKYFSPNPKTTFLQETKVFKSKWQQRANSSKTGFKAECRPDSNWVPCSQTGLKPPSPVWIWTPPRGRKSDSNCATSPEDGKILDSNSPPLFESIYRHTPWWLDWARFASSKLVPRAKKLPTDRRQWGWEGISWKGLYGFREWTAPPPIFFFLIMQFSDKRGKPLIGAHFGLRAPPGVKTLLGPFDQNPGSAPDPLRVSTLW